MGLAAVGNTGGRLAAGGAESGEGAEGFSSSHASTGVTGAVDAEALPYNEAAGFAALNAMFSAIPFILGRFDATLIQQD